MARETQIICKNIFKSSDEKILREEFTKKWIELIEQREKDKAHTAAAGGAQS